jgi:Caspase domain
MSRRAVICVGVDRAGSMTPLRAAAKGARDFASWAEEDQRCDTTLLTDEDARRVTVAEIFDVVDRIVNAGTYGQLIIYFSGHGILTAPGAEYWLLSRSPQNPNEAVNVSRSVVDARNSGIPHVVFISDACRSSVTGPPLSGVTGGVIFPSRPIDQTQGEVDVYYATRPGDPAYEVPEAEATQKYRGIFTDGLLKVVKAPPDLLVETVQIGSSNPNVITSRKMKIHLEATVPVDAADLDVKLRQALIGASVLVHSGPSLLGTNKDRQSMQAVALALICLRSAWPHRRQEISSLSLGFCGPVHETPNFLCLRWMHSIACHKRQTHSLQQ